MSEPMKKVVLIGERCSDTHDLYFNLGESFEVKLCTTDFHMFQKTYKAFEPDLIVMCFVDYLTPDNRFLNFIVDESATTPVITVGLEMLGPMYNRMLGTSVKNLPRAGANKLIVQQSCRKLGLAFSIMDKKPKNRPLNSKPLVLVVDDFALFLRQLRMMLKDKYDVEVATSGVQAMNSIGRMRPDVILLDYMMPTHDGKQIFEVLKMTHETKDIPVIFLTGVSDNKRVEEIINLRPAGYILKPPDKERLIAMVDDVLARKRRRIRKK